MPEITAVRPPSIAPARTRPPQPAPPAPARDTVHRTTPDTGSTPQTQAGTDQLVKGLTRNLEVAPPGQVISDKARAGKERIQGMLRRLGPYPSSRKTYAIREAMGQQAKDVKTALPHQFSPQEAAERRKAGVPAATETHPAGPPAAPYKGKLERDKDGKVRTGTLSNEVYDDRHQYVTVNPLPEKLTKEQAEEAFRRFNAPTRKAITPGKDGNPVTPNTEGYVHPGVFGNSWLTRRLTPLFAGLGFGTSPSKAGGKVTMAQGTSPEGRPWAINSTIPGQHPLLGHVTRTLVQEDGRYYIRTEGVGYGTPPGVAWSGRPHHTDGMVGPNSFNNLDERATAWAREHYPAR